MNQLLTDRMAERIYGTSRYQIWGDYIFDKQYSTNLVATVDGASYQTSDWASVYYNSSLFSSMSDAVTAFNEKHGTNIPQWNIETDPFGVQLEQTMQDINNYNKTATALDLSLIHI